MGQEKLNVILIKHTLDPEEIVAMSAKLCYSEATIEDLKFGIENKDQSKFIKNLMDMGHLSTVEHASFTFGVEGVSRALLAQITRHRLASFSVQSQRYVNTYKGEEKSGNTFGYIIPESIVNLGEDKVKEFENQMITIQQWYDKWIEDLGGVGELNNQDARFVLPNAAATKFIMTMNVRELLHFFNLRCCTRAQWEIRYLAIEMLKLVKEVAPTLFKNAGPGCVADKCPEGIKTCGRAVEMRDYFKNI